MKEKQKEKPNNFAAGKCGRLKNIVPGNRLARINKIIGGLIIILVAYFVMSINDLSVKGFILEELKADTITLINENNNTELRIMELESYDNLKNRALVMSMVKVDKIDYIAVTGAAMAKK